MTPADVRFGRGVVAARRLLGWSQTDLRRALGPGWHQTTISRIENGQSAARIGQAVALADALLTSIDRLLLGDMGTP